MEGWIGQAFEIVEELLRNLYQRLTLSDLYLSSLQLQCGLGNINLRGE